MLLSMRAQHRMAGDIPAQLADIQRSYGETQVNFARRVGRHVGTQILTGRRDPARDTRVYFVELALSPTRLRSICKINGVAEHNIPLALAATWERVRRGL